MRKDNTNKYQGPAGGWGSVRGIALTLAKEQSAPGALQTLLRQNKPKGFMCVSCSWAKPADYHPFEFCENGAKATLWELTTRRCTPKFFADHTLTELRTWSDYDLEQQGRLTQPLRYEPTTDRYVPCAWDEAFAATGSVLKTLDPNSVLFYASGRASLETSYLYGLFARLYGCNNLPDSSNMCHETTSVALKATIGVGVGTLVYGDIAKCDAMFFFGQNTGSNSPRFLHPLQDAAKRGVPIVTFNPLRERGLEAFKSPQSPIEMLSGSETRISTHYFQVRAGGDIAVMTGICKRIFEADDIARQTGKRVIDVAFVEQHTDGLQAFEAMVRSASWADIEHESGLSRSDIEQAANVFIAAQRVATFYGMGLTQHAHGFDNVAMVVNMHLLRGMIGREGAGISPVRGHSNVQGQRTVGIATRPADVPLDKFASQFGFEPPRDEGLDTVDGCKAVLARTAKGFIGLGGNLLRAVPDCEAVEDAWADLPLTVHVATKLNRTHLVPGKVAYLLPCLGRTEEDLQESGPQAVSMEDTFSTIYGSIGRRKPASKHLRSEIAIVAGLAKATLPPNAHVPWDAWVADYALVREAIAETYPSMFQSFNARLWERGGFYRGNTARERVWETETKRASFTTPNRLNAVGVGEVAGRFRLMTLRSNDQFNTTIYGYSDRLRGIEGTRNVLLMSPTDIARAKYREGQMVTLIGDAEDGIDRRVGPLEIRSYNLPVGCLGAYYPETNPLVALSNHDQQSRTPGYKSVPVRIET